MSRRSARGLTLLEVIIASAVLFVISAAIYALLLRSSKTYHESARLNTLQRNARIVLDRMAEEIRIANPDTLMITTGSSPSVRFQMMVSFNAGVTTWGPTFVYRATDPAGADKLNPVDANNNGRLDDVMLVRHEDGAATDDMIVLSHYVKTGGFVVTHDSAQRKVTITLTLAAKDERNQEVSVTASTTVHIRNKSST